MGRSGKSHGVGGHMISWSNKKPVVCGAGSTVAWTLAFWLLSILLSPVMGSSNMGPWDPAAGWLRAWYNLLQRHHLRLRELRVSCSARLPAWKIVLNLESTQENLIWTYLFSLENCVLATPNLGHWVKPSSFGLVPKISLEVIPRQLQAVLQLMQKMDDLQAEDCLWFRTWGFLKSWGIPSHPGCFNLRMA